MAKCEEGLGISLSQLDQHPELLLPSAKNHHYDSDDDDHHDASHFHAPMGSATEHKSSPLSSTQGNDHKAKHVSKKSKKNMKPGRSGVVMAPPLVKLVKASTTAAAKQHTPATPSSPPSPLASSALDQAAKQDDADAAAKATGATDEGTKLSDGDHSAAEQPLEADADANNDGAVDPVDASDFKFLRVIGCGGYGKVFQVRKRTGRDEGTIYAAKVLKKASVMTKKKDIAHALAERSILEKIDFPFIVGLKYAFQTDERLYLIMPYLGGGELFGVLDSEGFLLEEEARVYIAELVLALEHLHSHGVIYRDLKPENIMLTSDGHIKLTDFGMCKQLEAKNVKTNTFCGTLEYMAPEVITAEGHNCAADWWSLGALTYDILAGRPPFTHPNRKKLVDNILYVRVQYHKTFTSRAKSFIRMFLRRNPDQRVINTDRIKGHVFFSGLDFDDVLHKRVSPPFVPTLADDTDHKYFSKEFTDCPVCHSPAPPVQCDVFADFNYVAGKDGRNLLTERPRRPEDEPGFARVEKTVHSADLSVGLSTLELNADGSAKLREEMLDAEAVASQTALLPIEEQDAEPALVPAEDDDADAANAAEHQAQAQHPAQQAQEPGAEEQQQQQQEEQAQQEEDGVPLSDAYLGVLQPAHTPTTKSPTSASTSSPPSSKEADKDTTTKKFVNSLAAALNKVRAKHGPQQQQNQNQQQQSPSTPASPATQK
ncbi:AGC/RSK/P70 protein kinase [Salpingoeca rosetta]|uniref:AGC/RSK/P70 protein kinase n=1 Tax=Salpingoeca rosetta (strain ATCC 50818 / BSB-021) TaxID=946362 RepID=F2U8V2_SALR5|nr:AGC/RSK/P70 protein kinase [Salpingoeca rosetta]EGD73155.1 AGC/RSK/P70 protein kinase [Salpingoeca rosetta]|eukprot:XP_004994186.1 AGC/RSK/P70 protein kinase [Salpingoeca rosetta]